MFCVSGLADCLSALANHLLFIYLLLAVYDINASMGPGINTYLLVLDMYI